MFGLIDTVIVRPIVNILFVIYNLVGDFGLAIILFVILVKLCTWPLLKRQMEQTRIMRQIQPELAQIKKNCNGNRQMESLQMMELYKRKNVKPFRNFALVLIQLPIFMALFTAINVTVRPCEVSTNYNVPVSRCANTKEGNTIQYNVMHSAYPFVENMSRIKEVADKQRAYFEAYQNKGEDEVVNYDFEPKLFGKIDLSVVATAFPGYFKDGDTYRGISSVVILVFALCSAFAQFVMTRQNDPTRKKGKKRRSLRAMMKEMQEGKDVDQAEINTYAQQQSTFMMPFMMLFIMISLPGAIVFYYLLNNISSIFMNKVVLNRKLDQMEESADKKIIKELKAHEAIEAEIVRGVEKNIKEAKSSHYGSKNKNKSADNGVHITRISASDKKKRRK
jgi:YidC/Oxa1 family membrane protein insertase